MDASPPAWARRTALLRPALGLIGLAAGRWSDPAHARAAESRPAAQSRPPRRSDRLPGERALFDVAALASHGHLPGEPDLVGRWTAIPARARGLRLVLHLHGFSPHGLAPGLVRGWLATSGLALPPSPPTLALLPRGRPVPGRPGAFDWPALAGPQGTEALLREALAALGPDLPPVTRLLVTAHSGGGAGLAEVLEASLRGGPRVDEAHLFDALYGDPGPLLRWANRRAADRRSGVPPPALVAISRPGTPTEPPSRRLAAELARAGLTGPRWRVLMTPTGHAEIPRRYGPPLLADATARLPATHRA